MRSINIKLIVLSAMFTALTAVCTAFISFPVLSNGGYIHLGDTVIIIAASLLPTPYAVFVGAVGGALGDLIVGAAIWSPFTLVIKALVAICISSKGEKMLSLRNAIGFFPIVVITTVGYYLAEGIIFGNFVTPLASVWGNVVQAIASIIIFTFLSLVLDKTNFKRKLSI